MPIEKLIARIFIALGSIFLLLTLTFYPPKFSIVPALFLMGFIIMNSLLIPAKRVENKKDGIISKILIILLAITILVCFICLILLWKLGYFWKF